MDKSIFNTTLNSINLNSIKLPLAQAGSEPSVIPTIAMMVGIFVIFYFLMIRPQQKKQKALKKQVSELKKGDKFISVGGMYGTVVGIKDQIITAKIAKDVEVEIAKVSISTVIHKN